MARSTIKIEPFNHRNQSCIALRFNYNPEIIIKVKSLEAARWSASNRCWYFAKEDFNLNKVFETLKPLAFLDYSALKSQSAPKSNKSKVAKKVKSQLSTSNANQINTFKAWMQQKRYSPNTIKTYIDAIGTFLGFYSDKEAHELTNQDLIRFNSEFILPNGYSPSYQNQVINAVKLFYAKQLQTSMSIEDIERPKRARILPKVIDKTTVQKMLTGIPNQKHKTALTLIYGLGLRRSELINLKLNDIDFRRKVVTIRNAKGQKDRMLPLSDKLIRLMQNHIEADQPTTYLIEGQRTGNPYSTTSVENIFGKYLGKVLKKHNFTPHCLRHSYATQLLEAGVDLRYIQELLGHKSSKTTEIYTHVSMKNLNNIKNPTDDFDL